MLLEIDGIKKTFHAVCKTFFRLYVPVPSGEQPLCVSSCLAFLFRLLIRLARTDSTSSAAAAVSLAQDALLVLTSDTHT